MGWKRGAIATCAFLSVATLGCGGSESPEADDRPVVVASIFPVGDLIQELAGEENYDAMKRAVMGVVGQHFRPEFINRIDETVVFHPLAKYQIRGIADIQLSALRARLAERELTLDVSDAFMDRLVDAGFDPVYGARPLKRAIQQELENPLAQRLLAGEFQPGDVIAVDLEEDEPSFSSKAA